MAENKRGNKQSQARRHARRPQKSRSVMLRRVLTLIVLASLVAIFAILAFACPFQATPVGSTPKPGLLGGKSTPTPTPSPTPVPTPTPSPTPYFYTPSPGEGAAPSVFGYHRELEIDGTRADSFTSDDKIFFDPLKPYTALEGVVTFRGDNLRSAASYGTATVTAKTLTPLWEVTSGSMKKGISSNGQGSWSGSGWVGQPLIVRWPESTKKIMNLYDSAKNKKDLVEVILATMDGNVYFLDLETGAATRDKLKIGMPFKGAGSLDPRGYPLLYLGSGEGYSDDKIDTRVVVYSLINFGRLYEFGKRTDPFAIRSWHAYDSSPLVHAETDTLLYPGENGILYRVKLNTQYDEAAGTISVHPDGLIKYRYEAERTGESAYWLGYEDSAAIWGEHLYLSDNAGLLQCINLNTMDIVWVQDTWDDTNGSPVMEVVEEEHTAYLYIGTSLHWKKKSDDTGDVAFFKIDAVSGKVVWQDVRNVKTVSGTSGGIQATAILGKHSISDLVIIPYSRTPSSGSGLLVALDKKTGAERWAYRTEGYSWGSPIDIYDAKGNAYIVVADTRGNVYLLEGKTGALLDSIQYENNNFEASPAAFGNIIVLGSRAGRIYGIKVN